MASRISSTKGDTATMIELIGKHNKAKVFTDMVDNETTGEVINLLNQEFTKDSKIRIMPDCHKGAGCTIGTTMTLKDKAVANLVGVDIGCLTGDTLVWCSAGHYDRIKDLAEMSTPFMTDSFDEEQQGFVESKAIAKLTRRNAELVAVTYTTHRIIEERNITTRVRCTPDHKYLVCTEHTGSMPNYKGKKCIWVEAKDLQPGMQLVSDCNYITVTEVEPLKDREDVYCLTVDETHNFPIEGGVIVHNCGMLTVKLTEKKPEIDLSKLDEVIRQHVPSGFNVHSKQRHATPLDCTKLACWQQKGAGINDTLAYRSVGTLGGGEGIASGKVKSLT